VKAVVDVLKWACQVGNPDKYGNKAALTGGLTGLLVVDTGIHEDEETDVTESVASPVKQLEEMRGVEDGRESLQARVQSNERKPQAAKKRRRVSKRGHVRSRSS